ncbi:MAG: spore germination protein, partial [Emergencia timonensis]
MSLNRYEYFLEHFTGQLPVGESFDLVERHIKIAGKPGRMYFVDGLTDGQKCQLLLNFLMGVTTSDMQDVDTSDDFLEKVFPFLASTAETDIPNVVKQLYAGLSVVMMDGFDKLIVADTRSYPSRSVQEPEKEKTLRGAKDGFTESFMENLGLIRRRIRDNRLIFKSFNIGEKSKTDVALCYMKG